MNSKFPYGTAEALYADTIRSFYGTPDFELALGATILTFAVIQRVRSM